MPAYLAAHQAGFIGSQTTALHPVKMQDNQMPAVSDLARYLQYFICFAFCLTWAGLSLWAYPYNLVNWL
ncbi:hypothetical protein L873DRAFT_1799736 [Choiromyces venosus 120613-1]|uniref:Uncharacterized protein n=1 Tax=Choiromyces venosus 120613-1 TaxID=1336337 RepID=A0A3N4K739_9PEZI|nr:hypothetical protein L873DRAFT_1799736 [Choiromyces venosus 120613-1]